MDRKYEICQINISSHVDRVAAVCVAILISDKGRTSFFGSVIQIRGRDDLEARVGDDLLGIVNIRPLQPHDQRDLELDALAGVDDAVGDRGAVHNAAKHIHQDGFHPLVFSDDAESLPHLIFLDIATDIKEIGRLATIELDDIHSRHGQPGTIHQASNVAIQLHIVEVVTGSINLPGVQLRGVLHVKDGLLPERGVVIKAKLGIGGVYLPLRCLCQWVDLQLKTVHVKEHGVQVLDLLSTLGHQLPLEAQELGELGGHLVRDPGVDVHRHLLDPLWGPFSNFFNVYATVRAGDDDWPIAVPVHGNAEIGFPCDVNGLSHHYLADWDALRRSLLGDQLVADHGVAEASNHTWVLGQVHTSLEAIVKVPLASASSQNLSLDHILLTWKCLGDLLSLIRIACHLELLDSNSIVFQQPLRLILQEV